MSPSRDRSVYLASLAAMAIAVALAPPLGAAPPAQVQVASPPTTDSSSMMQHHQQMMAKMQSMHGGVPTATGQDAFGAIGELVAILDADPSTDWSKVDIEALRRHLIDMNEVALNAEAAAKSIEGGVQIRVTGAGRTLGAIQRMLPMHAAEIDGRNSWSAKTSPLSDGVLLTVTSSDPKEVQRLRALGFAGIMVSGAHHQAHHLAIARGEPMHGH